MWMQCLESVAPIVCRVKGLSIAENSNRLAGVKPAIPTNLPMWVK